MTKFNKAQFHYSGGYLIYYAGPDFTGERKFVARFKYSRGPFKKGAFLTELIKNHTVESYFKAMETSSPLTILQDKNPTWYENILTKYKEKHGIVESN